ncbi:unnamed protein product [Phytophthora lilii]|uniref:Unnamed protein product n=1 Tax=Phytophthora lilii TaxID=2077276 RepID=A0A9W6WZB4_9STRA|nr:unnamed protein product [Phytophthora lilii]
MPPYVQLKSPFMSSSPETNLAQGLDRKAEYIDKDGVLRRSSRVTRRMVQRGVSIKYAQDPAPEEQAHTSFEQRSLEKQSSRRATMQLGEEAEKKRAANASLKHQANFDKEKWLKDISQRAAERVARQYEQQQQAVLALKDLVDVTENNTPMSPSRTNTFIDLDGNLRRRITAPPEVTEETQDGFISGPATPPPPAPTKGDEPHEYC